MGADNIFIFGMTVDEVEELRAKGYLYFLPFDSVLSTKMIEK